MHAILLRILDHGVRFVLFKYAVAQVEDVGALAFGRKNSPAFLKRWDDRAKLGRRFRTISIWKKKKRKNRDALANADSRCLGDAIAPLRRRCDRRISVRNDRKPATVQQRPEKQ